MTRLTLTIVLAALLPLSAWAQPALLLFPAVGRPGEVTLQGQSRRIAWEATAGQVQARIALWPLLSRRLHVPDMRAEDVRGGIRRVAEERVSPPPREGGWELQFDRIASGSIRRGYVDGMELVGAGRGEVGFYKQLRGGPMELMPSQVAFADARLARALAVMSRRVRLAGGRSWPSQPGIMTSSTPLSSYAQ